MLTWRGFVARMAWGRRRAWYGLSWLAIVTCLAISALVARSAYAAPIDVEQNTAARCVRGNLLVHAQVTANGVSPARLSLLTNGVLAREGAPWPGEDVVVVVRGEISFDLGSTFALEQLYLQLDADQAFALELSSNGRDWSSLPVPASPTATGLTFRTFKLNAAAARFVKLRATSDPPTLTLAEVGVVCQHEPKLRQRLAVAGVPLEPWQASWASRITQALTGEPAVSPHAVNVVKLSLVVLTLLLICAELRRRNSTPVAAWVLVAVSSAGAYLNFGAYHYPEFVHNHDVFHYFVGAKYFPELGYRDLYACAAVAEAESGFEQRVRLRAQRDLTTNRIEPGSFALAQGAECRKRFGASRWEELRHDVGYFADAHSVLDWHRVLKDHGFNATPTWIAVAHLITAHLPATAHTIGRGNSAFEGLVGALDPLLLLAATGAALWAFGVRASAVCVVVFACNPFAEFSWVGGCFLREAWLATLIVGLCLLKKQRFARGGLCLAFSGLLQLIPLPALALPLLAGAGSAWLATRSNGLRSWWKALSGQRPLRRMLAGVALGLLLLIPLSPRLSGLRSVGPAWSAFASNTAKHEATPSGNLLGLGSLLSFRPSTTVDVLIDTEATDPFARTRAAQLATRMRMRPVQGVIVAVALGLLVYALRRPRELWWTATLGLCLVPLALETSCYYSAWLCAFALLGHEQERLLVPLLCALVAQLAVKLGVSQAALQIACASGSIVLAVFAVLLLSARDARRSAHGPAADSGDSFVISST